MYYITYSQFFLHISVCDEQKKIENIAYPIYIDNAYL